MHPFLFSWIFIFSCGELTSMQAKHMFQLCLLSLIVLLFWFEKTFLGDMRQMDQTLTNLEATDLSNFTTSLISSLQYANCIKPSIDKDSEKPKCSFFKDALSFIGKTDIQIYIERKISHLLVFIEQGFFIMQGYT